MKRPEPVGKFCRAWAEAASTGRPEMHVKKRAME